MVPFNAIPDVVNVFRSTNPPVPFTPCYSHLGPLINHGEVDPGDSRVTSSYDCHASSTTSSFDCSIQLLARRIVYERKDYTVGTLTYTLCDCKISVSQVGHVAVGNFSTIVLLAGTTSR